jgi:peptidoglycan hydrolase-like protein with peptidoglycan-binding domain
MRKIHDFSSFSALYEADVASTIGGLLNATAASKLYDQTLGLILTTALNSYSSELTFPGKSYDSNIDADMASVKSAPVLDKPGALTKIIMKVKQAGADNTTKGAQEAIDAWVAAGTKGADALGAMINQYKDQPEELKHINDFINAKIDSYLKGIEDSSKANILKQEIGNALTKSESLSYEGSDEIFEGVFQGKKGMIEDVSKQITLVTAKLASLAQTPGMTADVQKLQTEVNQIAAKMGDLLDKKNSEINKEDVKKAATRLAEIPTEADKVAEKMLKQDATNKEAAAILVQALALVQDAKDKEVIYLQNREGEETTKKSNLKATVAEYNPEKSGEENGKVKEFQELVISKFKNVKAIANLPQFKKMGTDGKFGPGTAAIVKIIKSGYGLENPSSPDITNELFAELKKDEVIKESRIISFDVYTGISEAFNVEAATKSASTQKVSTGGGGKAKPTKTGTSKDLLYVKGDTGNVVVAINRIVGQIADEKNYTDDTVARVKAFQKLNGKFIDGKAGEDTLKALYNTRGDSANPMKLNDPKAPKGPAAYKILADLLGDIYISTKKTEGAGTLTDDDIMGETSGLSSFINTILPAAKYAAFLGFPLGAAVVATTIDALKDRRNGVKGVVDALDGWVKESDLAYVLTILKALSGKKMKDGKPAIKRFQELYAMDEKPWIGGAETLAGEVESVGTRTMSVKGDTMKEAIAKLLK